MTHSENYRLRKMARLASGASAMIDIGCTQQPNIFLKAKNLTGFDLVKGQLSDNYHDFILGDVFDIPEILDGKSFDCCIIGEVLEHIENPVEFLRKANLALKQGGKLILSTPNPNCIIERVLTLGLNRTYFYTKDHVMLYPQRWLIRILELAGFHRVNLHSGGIQLPGYGLVPFPRPWCYQTIAEATKST